MDLETLVSAALEEDLAGGDWTSIWTIPEGSHGEAVVVAKESLVAAGVRAVASVFAQVDPSIEVSVRLDDGDRVEAGGVVLGLTGPMRGILAGERVALNFLGHLSGIATLTRYFVDRVEGTGAKIIDTRKTTPGWRALEKDAVRAGGGGNHRMGLHDMVLIKDNHAAASGGVGPAIRSVLAQNDQGLEVEVEVASLEELDEALDAGADRLLLDNMSNEFMRDAVARVRLLRPAVVLEASGNMTLERVRSVAETGVDLISVGALTHSAPCADVSLRVIS